MVKYKIEKERLLFDNKALAALIIPLIIEQLLAVFVGMADSIMVASVGEAAVSGVSLVDNIMILFINAFAALATGGAVIAGQYLGQKNEKESCKAATQMIWFITILSLIIMGCLYLAKWFILHVVFGQIDADVMTHANTYLLIVTASIPFIALYNGGAAIFRVMGNSKVSMQVSIIMNVINVTGNAVLIFGFHRGTEGVAIPTLVSRIIAAVLIIGLLAQEKRIIHIEKSLRYRPDWRMIKRVLGIGIPNGLENSMFQLGKIIVLSLVSTFGTYAIAANAVSNAVANFQILPGMAINLAITAVIARCVGAGDYEQVQYFTKKLIKLAYLCMWAVNILIFFLLPLILWAYNLSDITAEMTRKILYFHSISCMLIWPISFSLPSTLRAAGDAAVTMVIALVSMWIFRIVFSYVLGGYLKMGVFGIWVAMVIDWCVRSICMSIRYKSGKWKLIRSI
ncbi:MULTISPECIES: MATE family efflux transporter [Lachnospiraceae]|uniref:Probable multidrug resistance protein NorM n=1 Tax=Faecalicatena acetigenes TaxID=2981790 RepID=A0ABT2T749_9FIRM|nr:MULTISPECIES: MATE family efflux transporter [Lachnospiraceae]MCU6746080.1 MATE family efflux transporter [Faecalicatena acetigenes]SCG93744.1 Staphylococcal virulence regulator protein A [uncultured Clostridium sp.]